MEESVGVAELTDRGRGRLFTTEGVPSGTGTFFHQRFRGAKPPPVGIFLCTAADLRRG